MDYFLTTYQKDYKWPVIRSCSDKKKAENEVKMRNVKLHDADPCGKEHGGLRGTEQGEAGGEVQPAQCGAPPQGEGSKYDQPNVYLRKLYMKYPYLYNVMKLTSPDEMLKKVMNEKYKSTYQIEYNKEDFYPANDFTMIMDVLEAAEAKEPDVATKGPVCTPGGQPTPKCVCAQGLAYLPCKCMTEASVRKIAIKPAPISKMARFPRDVAVKSKTKKKKEEKKDTSKSGRGAQLKVKPFCTEYSDTISRIGGIIIRKKLLYRQNQDEEENSK